MKIFVIGLLLVCLSSCEKEHKNNIVGTWELQTGIIIKNKDSVATDYTKGQRLIKIINDTHFSFLRHDLKKGTDTTSVFIAGGGSYSFDGKTYKEKLEFCTGRSWEGKDFSFEIEFNNDTLIQRGFEKNEAIGVDQEIIETYVRTNK